MAPGDCFFRLSNEPEVGSLVEMEITLPEEFGGSGKFLCRGKVVQVDNPSLNGRTGVLCSIEDYELIPEADSDDAKA